MTPENERDGILRKQPSTIDDRLELAQEFRRYLQVNVPVYVDPVDNRAWKALGAAPNIAFLVDDHGIVAARQGWFDGQEMQPAVSQLLKELQTRKDLVEEQSKAKRQRRDQRIAARDSAATIQPGGKANKIEFKQCDLQAAIRENRQSSIASLIKIAPDGADEIFEAEQGHPHSATCLMEAVKFKQLAAAELLLKSGAQIQASTRSYDSALQLAAEIGEPEMIRLLVKYHADVNQPAMGRTPLHQAMIHSHYEAAKALYAAGAKIDFYSSVGAGRVQLIAASLAEDPSRASRPDGAGRTPLEYAAANQRGEMVQLLLDKGAAVVDYNLSSQTVPLHYAIENGNLKIVEMLLKAGTSPNTALGSGGEDATSEPALHMAVSRGDLELLKLLLSYKVDLTVRDTHSQTALHSAAHGGNADVAKLLIAAGADVKSLTKAFSLPCGSGEEEIPQRDTPLHFAAACGDPATIKVLLAGGAEINAVNVHGNTPLMCCFEPPIYTGINEESRLKNVQCLLDAGAKVDPENESGSTVLDLVPYARYEKGESKQEYIDLLTKHGAVPGQPKKPAKAGRARAHAGER